MNATIREAIQAAAIARLAAVRASNIAFFASKGRAWIKSEALNVKEAIARQYGSATNYEGGGTRASLESQLEQLREAWILAK